MGGELLSIEVVKVPGKGRFSSTGKLGDVMKESIKAAEFYIKSNYLKLGIDQKIINDHLYTRNLPDVDLLIRTSGEQRISNFLLWQIAYAELYFTDVFWPDFTDHHLYEAIENYQNRERRFGKTSEQLN